MSASIINLLYGICAFAICFALVFAIAYIKSLCLKLINHFSRKNGENV